MHFTQATDYAFRIVLHLAAKPPGTIVSGQEIAKQEQVPVQFLRKVMRFLNRAGIVRSHRGVEGGFVLNRQPEEVSLLQVIEAMEGPVELSRCLVSAEGCKIGCSRVCPVHEALQGAGEPRPDAPAAGRKNLKISALSERGRVCGLSPSPVKAKERGDSVDEALPRGARLL